MPAGELFIQLAVGFPDNPKVRSLVRHGRDVRALRDLYVAMLLYCKGSKSDGFVPDEQVGLLVYPDSEKAGRRDAGRLADAALIERRADGWYVSGWFDRNPSRAEIERKSEAKARGARLAMHNRFHASPGSANLACEFCQDSDKTSYETGDKSTYKTSNSGTYKTGEEGLIGAAEASYTTETESESETESEEKDKDLGRQKPAGNDHIGTDDDPGFAAFWDVYPRKAGKGQARRAWRTAVISKKTDPDIIVAAAVRFRDDPETRAKAREFIAHPATWLNGERWLEHGDDTPAPRPPGYSNSPWDN